MLTDSFHIFFFSTTTGVSALPAQSGISQKLVPSTLLLFSMLHRRWPHATGPTSGLFHSGCCFQLRLGSNQHQHQLWGCPASSPRLCRQLRWEGNGRLWLLTLWALGAVRGFAHFGILAAGCHLADWCQPSPIIPPRRGGLHFPYS
jgi:hypothetical protein